MGALNKFGVKPKLKNTLRHNSGCLSAPDQVRCARTLFLVVLFICVNRQLAHMMVHYITGLISQNTCFMHSDLMHTEPVRHATILVSKVVVWIL
jgi:hypothetical protein